MTDAKWIWLASIYIASITANAGLLKIITDDKLKRPNLVAAVLNLVLSSVGAYFGYKLVGNIPSFIFILFNIGLFFLLTYIVKKRDVKAVLLAEKLFPTFHAIDLQIAFILSEMNKKGDKDLGKPIRRALRYILSEMPIVFGFDSTHHIQSCILVPENFKFKVMAYSGIPNYKVDKMEEMFHYGPNPISIAGHAVNDRKTIIINDLSDQRNTDGNYWVKITDEDAKEGSLLAHPIFRGIGTNSVANIPIVVLCVTSLHKNAFDVEETNRLLSLFSVKVEILQNSWDIVRNRKKV